MFDINHLAMKFYMDELHRQVGRRGPRTAAEAGGRRAGAGTLLAVFRGLPVRRLVRE
jgi:hypothetical protein